MAQDCLTTLKTLRQKINWEVKKEREDFRRKLYSLTKNWSDRLPNLRDIFRREEIDWLLTKSVTDRFNIQGELFIRFVVRTGYKDDPDVDDDGKPLSHRNTPVHRATSSRFSNGDTMASELFKIYDRFDVNYVDDSELTHFHVACESGCEDVVIKFLELGQDPNCLAQKSLDPPLHLALRNSYEQVAKLLMRKGADPNLANAEGSTPLHVICKRFRDDEQLEMLFEICNDIQQTVQVDAQDNLGNTPLHLAMCYGKSWVAEFLLTTDANPNLADVEGFTPLHIICKRDDFDCDENVDLAELLFLKFNENKYHRVQVDAQDKLGNTPLHLALDNGYANVAELLMRKGANPNVANEEGSTPLHVVCQRDNGDDLVELFFQATDRADRTVQIDARDKLGRTPLQWAAARFLPNTVDVLLIRGADLSSFAFPTESEFDVRFKSQYHKNNFPLQLASGAMTVVKHLEDRGYRLNHSDALKMMKFFAKHELFEKSEDLEEGWKENEKFMSKAKKIKLRGGVSLYNLIHLQSEEVRSWLRNTDYLKLSRSDSEWPLSKKNIRACNVHLCEKLSRGFFRHWALDPFLKLTHYRLPLECCEQIIDSLMNEDLYHICLAAAG